MDRPRTIPAERRPHVAGTGGCGRSAEGTPPTDRSRDPAPARPARAPEADRTPRPPRAASSADGGSPLQGTHPRFRGPVRVLVALSRRGGQRGAYRAGPGPPGSAGGTAASAALRRARRWRSRSSARSRVTASRSALRLLGLCAPMRATIRLPERARRPARQRARPRRGDRGLDDRGADAPLCSAGVSRGQVRQALGARARPRSRCYEARASSVPAGIRTVGCELTWMATELWRSRRRGLDAPEVRVGRRARSGPPAGRSCSTGWRAPEDRRRCSQGPISDRPCAPRASSAATRCVTTPGRTPGGGHCASRRHVRPPQRGPDGQGCRGRSTVTADAGTICDTSIPTQAG